ncbi:hypothetical protein GCM10010452_16700 [Crossiella cryophila]
MIVNPTIDHVRPSSGRLEFRGRPGGRIARRIEPCDLKARRQAARGGWSRWLAGRTHPGTAAIRSAAAADPPLRPATRHLPADTSSRAPPKEATRALLQAVTIAGWSSCLAGSGDRRPPTLRADGQ